jgi:hypothetical protein
VHPAAVGRPRASAPQVLEDICVKSLDPVVAEKSVWTVRRRLAITRLLARRRAVVPVGERLHESLGSG